MSGKVNREALNFQKNNTKTTKKLCTEMQSLLCKIDFNF